MSLAKFNKSTNLFTKDTSHYTIYKKSSEVDLDKELPVFGFFKNTKSRFGDYYVAISDGYYINLPRSMNETIENMCADKETVDLLNAGNEKISAHKVFSDKWQKDIIVFDFV